MVIDIDVPERCGGKSHATLSNPVVQRMMDGKALGIAIKPLSDVTASFCVIENQDGRLNAKLPFILDSDLPSPLHRNQ
jgi:hypothetical protein